MCAHWVAYERGSALRCAPICAVHVWSVLLQRRSDGFAHESLAFAPHFTLGMGLKVSNPLHRRCALYNTQAAARETRAALLSREPSQKGRRLVRL